jgi:hypothetical protein
MIPQILIATSAAIALVLGFLHLVYTFFTRKLNPRDEELERLMREVSPRLTRETTMWKGWIAFNASHSLGIILFGMIYGYLSLFAWALLVRSAFFLGLGIAFFASYLLLAKRYMFRSPLRSVALAGSLYFLGFVMVILRWAKT